MPTVTGGFARLLRPTRGGCAPQGSTPADRVATTAVGVARAKAALGEYARLEAHADARACEAVLVSGTLHFFLWITLWERMFPSTSCKHAELISRGFLLCETLECSHKPIR